MPPSNCFETGRRSQTQSSVRPFGAETANGGLVLDRRGTTAERREGELERPEDFCQRSSRARQESFCPLDTDLSWMSPSRKQSRTYRPAVGQMGLCLVSIWCRFLESTRQSLEE